MAASIRRLAIATPLVALAFLAACSGEAVSPGDTNTPVETPTPPAATATVGLTARPTLPSPEDIEGVQALIDELNAASERDRAENPRFSGRLGDFIVTTEHANNTGPCKAVDEIVPSPDAELFFVLPNGDTPDSTLVCADGTETWMSGASLGRGVTVQRFYFTDTTPEVFIRAPIDRISLLVVGGKPAIMAGPLAEFEQRLPVFAGRVMFVIERFPSADEPGIMLVLEGAGTTEQLVAAVEFVIIGGGLGRE